MERCAGWTYRLMVDEGLLALSNGVANHFTATAPSSFEWSWGEQEWQLLQGEIPNAICRKTYRYPRFNDIPLFCHCHPLCHAMANKNVTYAVMCSHAALKVLVCSLVICVNKQKLV